MVLQAFIVRIFAVVVLALAVFVVSWPALSGQFWLDDYGVLPPLFEQQKHLGTLYSISTGETGPLGRPLSLLSFALQADSWPKAHDFILVNIAIHSINALMVFCLLLKLFGDQSVRFLQNPNDSKIVLLAFSVALLWALSPVLASSVFYVVQRMTLLASFFVLLSLLAYLYSWKLISRGRVFAISFCFLVCGLFSVLGMLAKESAVLVLVYAIALHLVLEKGERANKDLFFNKIAPACLILAILLVIAYTVYKLQVSYLRMYDDRDFSLLERLLSQARIQWSYLVQTVLPKPSELGLFHDDYPISKGLFSPVSTIYAVLAWLVAALVSIYFFYFKKNPLILFALLWFLGGHALEGTVLPLELYFEHRNYLPALAVLVLAVYILLLIYRLIESKVVKFIFVLVLVSYSVTYIGISYYTAQLWGDPNRLSLIYAEERPGSIRARALRVSVFQIVNEPELALKEIRSIQRDFPNELAPYLTEIEMACVYGIKPSVGLVEGLPRVVRRANFSVSAFKSIMDLIELRQEGKGCTWFDYGDMESLLLNLLADKKFKPKQDMSRSFLALVTDLNGSPDKSLNWLKEIEVSTFQVELRMILMLIKAGEFDQALELLRELREKDEYGLELISQQAYLQELEVAIIEDLKVLKKHDK